MTPVQHSKGQRDLEAPWLGTCAIASSVTTPGDVITHLRAISERVVPTTVLSGTHWRQRLARLFTWFNDALPLFQKNFCLLCNQERLREPARLSVKQGSLLRQHILPDSSTLTTCSTCCSEKKGFQEFIPLLHTSPNLSGLHLNWIN